jgi:hypothetical protein
MAGKEPLEVLVEVTSIYGAATRKGLVQLRMGDFQTQMQPDEAREIAGLLYGAAEAAEMDALLVGFLMERVEMPLEDAARILLEFQAARGGEQ